MRNAQYTITLNLPNDHCLEAMFPIECGPNCGHDVLMLMYDLRGGYYVVRADLSGKHISTSATVAGKKAGFDLVQKMLNDQSDLSCAAVTGGGRWGCE